MVDLIDSGEELSLVANVLADALERGLVEDEGTLREKIDARGGQKPGCRRGTACAVR